MHMTFELELVIDDCIILPFYVRNKGEPDSLIESELLTNAILTYIISFFDDFLKKRFLK